MKSINVVLAQDQIELVLQMMDKITISLGDPLIKAFGDIAHPLQNKLKGALENLKELSKPSEKQED